MEQSDRECLIEIRTLLKEAVLPRLDSHGNKIEKQDVRLKAVEKVCYTATILWGAGVAGCYLAKDAAAEWLRRKVNG